MGKAIIRMQKLKSSVAVRRSMKHAFREQETPNADPERTPGNTHLGAQSTAEAMQKFNAAMPDKVRKNGVLAVEYLITGSPDAMKDKTIEQQNAYFDDSLTWLKNKHGAANIIYAGIHRDETTPHMYAYVIPKDERGHLNCRAFFGAKDSLSKMQTDFADSVAIKHDLERGVEGSKARHTKISQYYARVNAATPTTPVLDLPKAKIFETKETYAHRVADSILKQLAPQAAVLKAKAQQTEIAQKEARAAEAKFTERGKLLVAERAKSEANAKLASNLMRLIAVGGPDLASLQAKARENLAVKDKSESR